MKSTPSILSLVLMLASVSASAQTPGIDPKVLPAAEGSSGRGGGDRVETLYYNAWTNAQVLLNRLTTENLDDLELSPQIKAWLSKGGPKFLKLLQSTAQQTALSFIEEPCKDNDHDRSVCYDWVSVSLSEKQPVMIVSRPLNARTTLTEAVALTLHEIGHLAGESNHLLLSQFGIELQHAIKNAEAPLLEALIAANIEARTRITFYVTVTPKDNGTLLVQAEPTETNHGLPSVTAVLKDVSQFNLDEKLEEFLRIAEAEANKAFDEEKLIPSEKRILATLELTKLGSQFNNGRGTHVTAGARAQAGGSGQWMTSIWVQLPGVKRKLRMRSDSGTSEVQWMRTLVEIQGGKSDASDNRAVAKVSGSVYTWQTGYAVSGDRMLKSGLYRLGTVQVATEGSKGRTRTDLELVGVSISNGATLDYFGAMIAASFGLGMRVWDGGRVRYDAIAHGSVYMCLFIQRFSLFVGTDVTGTVVPFSEKDGDRQEVDTRFFGEFSWMLPTKRSMQLGVGISKRREREDYANDPYELSPLGTSGYLRFTGRF